MLAGARVRDLSLQCVQLCMQVLEPHSDGSLVQAHASPDLDARVLMDDLAKFALVLSGDGLSLPMYM